MPYPIQLGAITDRMRNFFRIRGKTSWMLDEVIVPVTMVQDLTQGPYQAGVVPVALEINQVGNAVGAGPATVVVLNNKVGSLVPSEEIQKDLKGQSLSITYVEMFNTGGIFPGNLFLFYVSRDQVEAIAAAPLNTSPMNRIQFGGITGSTVNKLASAEAFAFDDSAGFVGGTSQRIWAGTLAATPGVGSLRIFEPVPALTIGVNDGVVLLLPVASANIRISMRGFYNFQVE